MTQNSTNEEQQKNLKNLQSTDSTKVIEALEDLKVSGKVSDIPVLVELLHLSQNQEIKSKITSLFATLKDNDAIPLLIEAIQNPKYESELRELVSACWENGLDYGDYLPVFIDLLIENDFLIAFEAYTVIMNMTTKIDQAKLDVETDRLEKALSTTTEQKRQLILDVIDFLPSIGF